MRGISSTNDRFRKFRETYSAEKNGKLSPYKHTLNKPLTIQPRTAEEIAAVLTNPKKYPSPVRPVGANSSITRCTNVQEGTILDMRNMNRIVQLTPRTVTVQAGLRLRDLARKLAEHDLELVGSYDQPDRTVGGVISSGSLSAGTSDDGGHLAASVCGIRLVSAQGRLIKLNKSDGDALKLVLQGHGLLGVIYMVTLRIRVIRSYSVRHGKAGFAKFSTLLPTLAKARAGVKMYLLPFKDSIYIELREAGRETERTQSFRWKVQDCLINRILPEVVHTLGRAFSVGPIRYPLVDGFSQATQMLVNTTLVDAGSNAVEQTGQFRKIGASSRIRQCTWLFPAGKFSAALYSYREFCRRYYKVTRYRCDLPSIGCRISRDTQAVLSPSFDGPVFALTLRSTNLDGWDDFLVDFGRIAANFSGIPLFNQTKGFTPDQASVAYGKRLKVFRAARQKADPENRLLNQFFAEYIG
jgi:hypothetical protein